MAETVILELPEETMERYRRGAAVAHKPLAEFLVERIVKGAPPFTEDIPPSVQDELRELMDLNDEQLWEVAESRLPTSRQRIYTRLLNKNSDNTLSEYEREKLRALGDEARRLTLRKAQAYVLLRWRGYRLPTRDALLRAE